MQKLTPGLDGDGFATETWANVLAGGGMIRCKWVSAHGTEVIENNRLDLGQVATITLRYTSLINERCRVFYETDTQDDTHAWQIISINDPEDRHAFLEITLRRAVIA